MNFYNFPLIILLLKFLLIIINNLLYKFDFQNVKILTFKFFFLFSTIYYFKLLFIYILYFIYIFTLIIFNIF